MKKKIFLLIMVVSVLLCLFAISVSASDYDTTREVTLDSGAKVDLYDGDGNALTWYMSNGTLTSKKTVDLINVNTSGWITYKTDVEGFSGASSVVVANFQEPNYTSFITNKVSGLNETYRYSENLEYVFFADEIKQFNQWYTFSQAKKLKTAEFTPNSQLNSLMQYMFHDCDALTSFYFPPLLAIIPNGDAKTIGFLTQCANLRTVTIANRETFTHLGNSAFSQSTALESISIPDSTTYVGTNAFYGCTSLTTVNWPANTTTVSNNTFEGCSSLVDFKIPDYVTSIGIYSFAHTGIIDSPFSVNSNCTYINKWAFAYCSNLQNINIPRNATFNTTESSEGVGLFQSCTSLTEVNFHPNTIDTLYPSHMFSGCSALKEIQLPNILTQLPVRLFNNCTGLETIIFGANVIGINNLRDKTDHNSFTYNCNNLKYVYLPKTLNIDAETHKDACHVFGSGGNITFYYNGSYEQAVALQNQFKNNVTTCGNNGKITGAEIISLEEYNKLTEIKKCYLVYDGNTCDMFYNGVHGESQVSYGFEGEDYTTDLYSFTGCSRCNDNIKAFVCGPLFTNKGYSKVTDGSMFTYGISINEENIETYKSKTGNTFSYGFIVGAVPTTPTGNIIDVNGNALIEKSVVVDFATVQFSSFTIYNVKMCDIDTTQQTMPVYCCAYIIDGSQVSYIGNSVTTVAASISSSALEVIEKATTTKGDENA